MLSRPGVAALALATTTVLTASCAPASEDVPQSGSQLRPDFRDRDGKGARDGAARDVGSRGDRDGKRTRSRAASPAEATAGPGEHQTGASAAGSSASPFPSGGSQPDRTESARVADDRGDVSGVWAPAYVDLAAATLTRSGGTFRLVVETSATLPTRQADSRTMNVVGFFDTDLDGQGDHEVWATLSDNGWATSARHPDRAAFGPGSGVRVEVTGSTLTFAFAADLLGDPARAQWSVATEHGTYEQVASGTTAQDRAPASGGALFPG